MGDRSNIAIVNATYVRNEETRQWERDPEKDQRVYLYSHWGGPDAIGHARHGLSSGRVSDGSYLARIIFSSMIQNELHDETGYGIATSPPDNEYPIIVIDPNAPDTPVWIEDEEGKVLAKPITAAQFVALDAEDYDTLIRQMKAARKA